MVFGILAAVSIELAALWYVTRCPLIERFPPIFGVYIYQVSRRHVPVDSNHHDTLHIYGCTYRASEKPIHMCT